MAACQDCDGEAATWCSRGGRTDPDLVGEGLTLETGIRAVVIGVVVLLAGTLPRNLLFAANLRFWSEVPWAVPIIAGYLWLFWRYLNGAGPPPETAEERRTSLRAQRVSGKVWLWALLAGGIGLVALVLALRVINRLVVLPVQRIPDLSGVPDTTIVPLLLLAAPVAGVVEESAFRGYMQGPLERQYGLGWAILITGTAFALVHLDFTLILWPYYLAVAALYGTITYLSGSILPAVVLHTGGNLYSNLDLWLRGRAEWQAGAQPGRLIWETGSDPAFVHALVGLLLAFIALAAAFHRLARVARPDAMAG